MFGFQLEFCRQNVSCVREMSGRKVSVDSTLKWLLTFLGWSLFMDSHGRYTEPGLFFSTAI